MNTNETAVTWWRGFNDPELNQLVDRALAGNHDLRIATANLREARALRREAQFDLLPVPQGTAGYTDTRYSQAFEPGVARGLRDIELYDVGFDATWELDFFGRVRRSVQAATAEVQAAAATRRDVMVTLISEVARNYFELRGTQTELAVAQRNADNQRQTMKITQDVLEGGRGTELDVARARAQLNNTLANIPPLEAAISRAMHRLSVLTGQQPTALVPELKEPDAVARAAAARDHRQSRNAPAPPSRYSRRRTPPRRRHGANRDCHGGSLSAGHVQWQYRIGSHHHRRPGQGRRGYVVVRPEHHVGRAGLWACAFPDAGGGRGGGRGAGPL